MFRTLTFCVSGTKGKFLSVLYRKRIKLTLNSEVALACAATCLVAKFMWPKFVQII